MALQYMEDGQISELLEELINSASSPSLSTRHGAVLTMSSMLKHNPSVICASPTSAIVKSLQDSLKDEKVLGPFKTIFFALLVIFWF